MLIVRLIIFCWQYLCVLETMLIMAWLLDATPHYGSDPCKPRSKGYSYVFQVAPVQSAARTYLRISAVLELGYYCDPTT